MDQTDCTQPQDMSQLIRRARSQCRRATACFALFLPCIATTLLMWDWVGVFGRSSIEAEPIPHNMFWKFLVVGVWLMTAPWLVAWWSIASRDILKCVALIAGSEAAYAAGDGTRSGAHGMTLCLALCIFLWGLPLYFEAYDLSPLVMGFAFLGAAFLVLQAVLVHLYTRRVGWLLASHHVVRLSTYALMSVLVGAVMVFIATGSMYDNTPQGQDRLMLGIWIVIILTVGFEAAMLVSLIRSLRRVVEAASRTRAA